MSASPRLAGKGRDGNGRNSKGRVVYAGGAVVTRASEHRGLEVVIVHRQRYRDWTLPKGKLDSSETIPAAAVREVREETGASIRLGVPLDQVVYPIERSGVKKVFYWHGVARQVERRPPDDEVDVVAWLPVKAALARLTYDPDRRLVEQSLAQPPSTPLVLVRHGKAMDRKDWTKPDQARPLAARGRRQATELVPILDAFGVGVLVSSSARRCVQTLQPYAEAASLEIERIDQLTQEKGSDDPVGVADVLTKLRERVARDGVPMALSLHRPVLPHILDALDVAPTALATGECLVVHITSDSETLAIERHRPLA